MEIRILGDTEIIAQDFHLIFIPFFYSGFTVYESVNNFCNHSFRHRKSLSVGNFRNLQSFAHFVIQQKPCTADVKVTQILSLETVFQDRVFKRFIQKRMSQQNRIFIRRRLNRSPQIEILRCLYFIIR